MVKTFNHLHTSKRSGISNLLALHQQAAATFPFLLQSAIDTAQSQPQGRYDILFAFPGEQLTLNSDNDLYLDEEKLATNHFLDALDARWQNNAIKQNNESSLPFRGGWFIYLGYELAAQVEPRLELPMPQDGFPVAVATRIPAAIINDHHLDETILIAETQQQHDKLKAELESLRASTEATHTQQQTPIQVQMHEDAAATYLQQVERVKQYIVEGDVFQVNLSRAWQGNRPEGLSALDVYQNLKQTNPAPFAALASFQWGSIISSSPERLVQVKNGIAETRPIAGTRPRSRSGQDDAAYKSELIAHPKERAEHIMLIDLERNDLGRICQPGSIHVNEMMVLESYAHVHHIVSNIKGELRPDVTPGNVIAAVFPGGTITGCPKERCMAIIAELEQEARGPYTGSLGYINHNGDMDLNILIRTISMNQEHIRLRAGAGLVTDSIAQMELEETRHKARGMLLALGATQ